MRRPSCCAWSRRRPAPPGCFSRGEVKLRLSLYEHFSVGGSQEDFVHLIFYILAGRPDEQKRLLSRQIVRALVERLPSVNAVSLDVRDIDCEVFSNKRSHLAARLNPRQKLGALATALDIFTTAEH